MVFRVDGAGNLLWGPQLERHRSLPLTLWAVLPDLRSRFLAKGQAGRGYRAIARNGRVLLASDRPLSELAGQTAQVRFQPWHRVLLPGDPPRRYGVLVCVRTADLPAAGQLLTGRLLADSFACGEVVLAVGGQQVLVFA